MSDQIVTWIDSMPVTSPVNSADQALAIGLAHAVDADFTNAALWKRLQDAVEVIRLAIDNPESDPIADALASLAGNVPSKVRNGAD
ncbi:MAG: hypothetical protein HKN01_01630 [Acidimicrobiia bacterium]|nr:hypothetical protein [Acidimicrobiia bacterium]